MKSIEELGLFCENWRKELCKCFSITYIQADCLNNNQRWEFEVIFPSCFFVVLYSVHKFQNGIVK